MGQQDNDHLKHASEVSDFVMDQIRKLAELREDGVLTEEEFAARKAELLDRL